MPNKHGYPTFQDITALGYTPEAARNTLNMIDMFGGEPFIIWQSLRDGDRDAKPPITQVSPGQSRI